MKWAIVADDLTGAADASVVFADIGIKTTVWLNAVEEFPEDSCCSVDADVRWRDIEATSKLIRKHVTALKQADWLMLKIDSTLRGFVGAMVQSAWEELERKWLLFAPAVPKQGRIVKCGHLLVHGKPVSETDLAKEQPVPITTSCIAERLRQTGIALDEIRCIGLSEVRRKGSLKEAMRWAMESGSCLVCDAEMDKDLNRLMVAVSEFPSRPLLVGASGLAKGLARTTVEKQPKQVTLPFRPQKALVVVGSQQNIAQQQLKFLEAKSVPVVEWDWAKFPSLPDEKVVAVRLKMSEEFCGRDFAQMRKRLGDILKGWFEQRPCDVIVIVGGLTARTLFEALGVKRWDLLGSLLPGMPLGLIPFGDKTFLVATKAGGFGTEQTLWQAVKKLLGVRKGASQVEKGGS